MIPLLLILTLSSTPAWPDSVAVGDSLYAVTSQWRGQRLDVDPSWIPDDLRPLPDSLCSDGTIYLREDAARALTLLLEEARRDSVRMTVNSGFRSAATQARLIQRRLDKGRGFEEILWSVAPPGYSEHMLGTTADLALGYGETRVKSLAWMRANAWRWRFVQTYGADPSRRFPEEPWHWRRWEPTPREEGHARP